MSVISGWGKDSVTERNLFSLHLENAAELKDLSKIDSTYFVCFLGWNSLNNDTSSISQVVESLLKSGGVYFCTWGSGCERVHDIIDEVSIGSNPPPEIYPGIMTTWHEGESFDQALWTFLNCTYPYDTYWDGCKAAIAITIGLQPDLQTRTDFALANPDEFAQQVLANDKD
jgi:hypothetical protein